MMSSSSIVQVLKVILAFMSITVVLPNISGAGYAFAKCRASGDENQGLKHLAAANGAYEEGAFETALLEYQAAYGVCLSGIVFYGIANCEAALARDDEAARDFERFLREAPDAEAELRQTATEKLAALSARLTSVALGGATDHAAVFLDERAVHDWVQGATLYMSPGQHSLRVESGVVGRFERVLAATEGARLRVEVPMKQQAIEPERPPPAPRRRWWLWGGIATALVAGAVAAYVVSRPDRPPCPTVCP